MIHVLFSSSAAGTLRQLLHSRGIGERVVDLSDDLDWGPVAFDDFEAREAWFNRNIPWKDGSWDWIADAPHNFQYKVERDPERLIWIAPRSASEQCGLHWYLDHFGGHDGSMIVADYPLPGAWRGKPPFTLGELRTLEMGHCFTAPIANREILNDFRRNGGKLYVKKHSSCGSSIKVR